MYLFSVDGSLLWYKQVRWVRRVEIGNESDKVIVIHDYKLRETDAATYQNTCFDLAGNKMWELSVPPGGITMGPGGRYGILSSSGEMNREFRVYDLQQGKELDAPLPDDYSHFRAQFVDTHRVIILLQKIITKRDQDALRRLMESERATGRGRGKGKPGLLDDTWIDTYYPGRLILYDIPSNSILLERELFTREGMPLYVPHHWGKYMLVSSDKENVTVALYKSPPSRTESPLSLYQIDFNGEVVWENSDLTTWTIDGLLDLSEEFMLIREAYGTAYQLVDKSNGKTVWRQQKEVEGRFKYGYLEGGEVVLHTLDERGNSRIQRFDMETGNITAAPEFSSNEFLIMNSHSNTVVFRKAQKQLEFLKRKEAR